MAEGERPAMGERGGPVVWGDTMAQWSSGRQHGTGHRGSPAVAIVGAVVLRVELMGPWRGGGVMGTWGALAARRLAAWRQIGDVGGGFSCLKAAAGSRCGNGHLNGSRGPFMRSSKGA